MKCQEKRRHLDRSEAKATLEFLKTRFREGKKSEWTKTDIDRLHVYRCPECRFWHIGKMKVKPVKLKAAQPKVRVPSYKSCLSILTNSMPPVLA